MLVKVSRNVFKVSDPEFDLALAQRNAEIAEENRLKREEFELIKGDGRLGAEYVIAMERRVYAPRRLLKQLLFLL